MEIGLEESGRTTSPRISTVSSPGRNCWQPSSLNGLSYQLTVEREFAVLLLTPSAPRAVQSCVVADERGSPGGSCLRANRDLDRALAFGARTRPQCGQEGLDIWSKVVDCDSRKQGLQFHVLNRARPNTIDHTELETRIQGAFLRAPRDKEEAELSTKCLFKDRRRNR